MKTFFSCEWEAKLGLPLPYSLLARVARAIAANLDSATARPCPLVPGKDLRDTHFIFLGLESVKDRQLTLVSLDELCRNAGLAFLSEQTKVILQAEPFATEVCAEAALYLVPAEYPFEDLEFEQQVTLIPKGYQLSSAVEAAQAQLLYRIKTGQFFGGYRYGRTADRDRHNRRIMIGNGESDGLHVSANAVDLAGAGIGLAIHQKIALPESAIEQAA